LLRNIILDNIPKKSSPAAEKPEAPGEFERIRRKGTGVMLSSRGAKPLVSIFLSLLLVLAFVLPFLQYNFLAGPVTPFDKVQAGAIRFGIIMALALIWLGVQLFWKAPSEATKLGMAASATIIWLALVFFRSEE